MSDSTSNHASSTVYLFENFRLEPARRSLTRLDGTALRVTGKPFDALVYLVQHAGEVVDRGVILTALWPHRVVEDNNINQAIAMLRRALGAHHIATIPGRGYQFVTPVQKTAAQRAERAELRAEAPAKQSNSRTENSGAGAEAVSAAAPPFAVAATGQNAEIPRRPLALKWIAAAAVVIAVPTTLLLVGLQEREPAMALGAIVAVSPVTTYPGEEITPSLSPNGTQVALSWDGDAGNEDIYVTQIGTGARARLTTSTDGADHSPAWSPDANHIALIRQLDAARFDVVMIPSLGGPETKLYSGERNWISREGFPLLAWTPDSRQLWFSTKHNTSTGELSYGLHRLWLETGDIEPLEIGGAADDYDTSPAISPDGHWLAFVRYRRGERLNQVMVRPLGPDFTPIGDARTVAEAGIHHSLAWAPRSDRLWFAKGGQILEWQVGDTVRVAAMVGPQLSLGAVTFTHDGTTTRAAAVTRRVDTDIFALPLDPVTHSAIGPAQARVRSTAIEYHPRFSANGDKLAFVSDRSGHRALWIAAANGADARQITDLQELVTGFPRWSPDGTLLAFHTSAVNENRVRSTRSRRKGALRSGC